MTTVIAMQASDGLVIGSDLQRTGTAREFVPKLKLFSSATGRIEMFGFAGVPFYEASLYRRIKRALLDNPTKGYEENLSDALDSYNDYLKKKLKSQCLNLSGDMLPQGILATGAEVAGMSHHQLFQFQPPDHLIEMELAPMRAAIGSGGDVATVYLKALEKFMFRAGIDQSWARFSSHTIRQLIWLLLDEASVIDPWTRGRDIQVITAKNVEGIWAQNPVFQSPDHSHLSEFVQNAINEMSSPMAKYMLDQFDLLDIVKSLRLD